MTSYLPPPDTRRQRRQRQLLRAPRRSTTAPIMYTGKVDHRFSDSVSLTGFYLYNKTNEPCADTLLSRPERSEPLHRSLTTTSCSDA